MCWKSHWLKLYRAFESGCTAFDSGCTALGSGCTVFGSGCTAFGSGYLCNVTCTSNVVYTGTLTYVPVAVRVADPEQLGGRVVKPQNPGNDRYPPASFAFPLVLACRRIRERRILRHEYSASQAIEPVAQSKHGAAKLTTYFILLIFQGTVYVV